jgi:hypothetical protein
VTTDKWELPDDAWVFRKLFGQRKGARVNEVIGYLQSLQELYHNDEVMVKFSRDWLETYIYIKLGETN